MADVKQSLDSAMAIEGAIGAALVDWASGMALGTAGGNNDFNLEIAAAGNTQVVRAKMSVMKNLGLTGHIEDILITLENQYHLIRPFSKNNKLFFYVALQRENANLAMARFRLAEIEHHLEL